MKNHGEAFEAIGSGDNGAVSVSAYFTENGTVTTTKGVVEITEWYAQSETTTAPADSEFTNVPIGSPDKGRFL